MICKIADLLVEVPEIGDLPDRCQEYIVESTNKANGADIIIRTERFRKEKEKEFQNRNLFIYHESSAQFSTFSLKLGCLVLHASAIEYEGKAYLFSAPSGTGKSTHTGLWKEKFGEKALIINDDKPVLRKWNGKWYAYGTPWCGKDGINQNRKAPLAGICFLKQAENNQIRRLNNKQALQRMIWQIAHNYANVQRMDMRLTKIEDIIKNIPIFELECRPEQEAVQLSYETMSNAAQELEL